MSAGAFTTSKYAADYGAGTAIHPIRVQPETLELTIGGEANSAPSGSVTNPISAVVSKGKRQKGLIPRAVTIKAPATGQPTGYLAGGVITLPLLNKNIATEVQNATSDTTVSYLGVTTWKVSGKSPEYVR